MEFRILGSMEVLDGTRRRDLPTGRGRALLALLVLHAGEPLSAERLVDELWDERPPATATTVVQGLVSRLRGVLEPGRRRGQPGMLLQTVGAGYRLAIDPSAVDAHRFKRLIDEARGATPDVRAAKLSTALGLWRGPALADFTYVPFAQRAISALEELRIEAIEDRFEAELALGRGRELVSDLEQLTGEHPFRERLRGFLMLALYRAGRQMEALEAYRSARSMLVEDIGVEPGPALRELEAAILRHDPSLWVPAYRREVTSDEGGSWLPRERRPVTVVAVDLAPSVEDAADVEAVAQVGARAVCIATEVLERHGGRVERVIGEMVIAFFGFPVAHEDDALRAARAAVEAHRAVEALNDDATRIEGTRFRSRAGIESGDIVVQGPGAGLHDVAGTVMSAATRLLQTAVDGWVVVGRGAQRLLRGAVVVKAVDGVTTDRGRATTWRVLEILSRAPAVPRTLWAPMFGRQDELTRLRSAFRRVVRSGTLARSTVLGEPGIGKSRLAKELVASIGAEAYAITLRCPPYAGEVSFFPMREAMIEAAGLEGWRALHDLLAADNDGQHIPAEIAAAIGLRAEPRNAAALFPALRGLFERLATGRPLIVVLEDLHWAEPTFLDLIDYLAREGAQRIFLLCLGRLELMERRPEWDSNDVLHLEGLSPTDLENLVLDRAASIAPDALRRIVAVSQGNPLFAEQLLAAHEDGTGDVVPASLLGVLNMRLDRLGPGERDLLRCASIVGMEFDRDAVAVLLPEEASPFMQRHLGTLERRRLIERTGMRSFRFRHVLIQLASYQSMTRLDRARLHQGFADWLERDSPGPELKETLGYHLEQAAEHRRVSGMAHGDLAVGS
ncbi:MAG: AAA family ATPase [Actinomycetota bacterium]|nr:AAA family ATPase [Actinomycetota bacterium]